MHRRTPLLLLPFVALWSLIGMILKATGRLVAVILGFVLLTVGVLLTITMIGAVIGIPLAGFGFLLMVRGFF